MATAAIDQLPARERCTQNGSVQDVSDVVPSCTSTRPSLGGLALRLHPQPRHGIGRFGVRGGDGRATAGMQSFVPARYAPIIAGAAQRWQVSAQLLAAQIYAESNFNPFAQSGAGAQGIAQFMPGTAAAYGVRNPFDAEDAIDGQAHLMHDLLARFASVPLALAAYNAGPGAVARAGGIPPYAETQAFVRKVTTAAEAYS